MTQGNSHKIEALVRPVLTDDGKPYVQFKIDDMLINFDPVAACDIAFKLLATAWAVKGEASCYALAQERSLDPKEVIKHLRSIK